MSDDETTERTEVPSVQVGEMLLNRYELVEYLGSGSLGHVFRARDHRLEFREVALKILRRNTPEDQVARFKREALLAGGISSPHVVGVNDFGRLSSGQAFLVMDLLRGENLAHRIKREDKMPVERALHIADGILAGLEAAHASGVVHRDLKPDNVFLVDEPGVRDYVKIVDFGFARVFSNQPQALDVTGEAEIVVGTVSYMAPEQLKGRADHRADLFSVAAMLFRMIAGELPYAVSESGGGMVENAIYRLKRINEPLKRLSDLVPDATQLAALDTVLHLCLDTDPDLRPPSAGAMRASLLEAVGGEALGPQSSEPGTGASVWRNPASGLHNLKLVESMTNVPAVEVPDPAASEKGKYIAMGVVGGVAAAVTLAMIMFFALK